MSGTFALKAGDSIVITPNNYEFGDTLYIVASNSGFSIDAIFRNSSTGVITSATSLGKSNLGSNVYCIRLASGTSSNYNQPIQITLKNATGTSVGISAIFIDSADKSVADLLAEVESFHSDVNDKLAEIYSYLPFTPNDNFTFGICSSSLAEDDDINISYEDAMSLINALNQYYSMKRLPLVNASGLTSNLRDVVNFYYDSNHSTIGVYVMRNGSPYEYALCLYDTSNEVLVRFIVEGTGVAVGGLNNSTDNFNNQVQQNEALEHEFTGSMSANFEALNLDSFDFNADTLSGMAVVGAIMTSLFNSMGKWGIVYTFPLLLGVVLVVIGRVARSDRKSYSGERNSRPHSSNKG